LDKSKNQIKAKKNQENLRQIIGKFLWYLVEIFLWTNKKKKEWIFLLIKQFRLIWMKPHNLEKLKRIIKIKMKLRKYRYSLTRTICKKSIIQKMVIWFKKESNLNVKKHLVLFSQTSKPIPFSNKNKPQKITSSNQKKTYFPKVNHRNSPFRDNIQAYLAIKIVPNYLTVLKCKEIYSIHLPKWAQIFSLLLSQTYSTTHQQLRMNPNHKKVCLIYLDKKDNQRYLDLIKIQIMTTWKRASSSQSYLSLIINAMRCWNLKFLTRTFSHNHQEKTWVHRPYFHQSKVLTQQTQQIQVKAIRKNNK